METKRTEQDARGAEDEADERRLIAGVRAGDPAVCAEFVQRFGGQMHSVARRFLRSDEDRDDAVQEAFLSAVRAIGGFQGQARLSTWLHRIVVNACLAKLRSQSRRSEVSIESLLPRFDGSGHHLRAVPRWRNAPDEQLLREETRSLIQRSIDSLPDDYRTVLLLRDVEGISTEETATILGVNVGTAKTRLHRARQALRTLLEPHFA
jgi:RNA polymerase sigma-70 factor, ECF subfamily